MLAARLVAVEDVVEFWDDVTAATAERYRAGDLIGGLVHGIETAGRELAPSLAYDAAADTGEGPDEVDVG